MPITWKTAQEQNSDHFDIQRSTDGVHWAVIGNLRAAGNSNTEIGYYFTDNYPAQNSYYRIAEYDVDGKVQFSNTSQTSCAIMDVFKLWPNPTHEKVFINIITGNESPASIKIYDNKGALIKMQKAILLPGSNQLGVDMKPLLKGVYQLSEEWNNGQITKSVRLN